MPPPPLSSTSPTTTPAIKTSKPTALSRFAPPSAALLIIYPITLVCGSLFSVLSPTASPASPSTKSEPINYFARKDNIFNLYFVKIGWIWFTLAFALLLLVLPPSPHRARRQLQAFSRYVLATIAWYATTQWFFGPAIIDRSFVLTGGKCETILRGLSENQAVQEKGVVGAAVTGAGEESLGVYLTAAACKAAGGAWRGGHDVSGHVFMLVLVTAVLAFEGVGVIASDESEGVNGVGRKSEGEKEVSDGQDEAGEVRTWVLRFVGAVVGLGYWMLLMTAIWFHTWLEKANGLVISLAVVYTIYILPRRVIPWRDIIGVPGL
ncbi:inositol phospholipid synthesis and fat-storage-inducing TM-domain-containing protein [Aspergillus karnatakaensis]|uniref:putative inositol phospholipid biosynthesis protein Scs3 n=1 Tax=Aspergillus karnatakaensis TaxID=1810916 RepID=UPI003CCE20C6